MIIKDLKIGDLFNYGGCKCCKVRKFNTIEKENIMDYDRINGFLILMSIRERSRKVEYNVLINNVLSKKHLFIHLNEDTEIYD